MTESQSSGSNLPKSVELIDVGPRDGFQMEERFIPTELKIETVEHLVRAGLREVEAVSFVHPRVIPQMRDAAEVMAGVTRSPDAVYWALVPNLRGAERALAADVDGIHQVICCTETYNQKNVGLTVDESLSQLREVVELAGDSSGERKVLTAATMAVTFGCPFEGQVSDERLVELAQRFVDTGIMQLGLGRLGWLGSSGAGQARDRQDSRRRTGGLSADASPRHPRTRSRQRHGRSRRRRQPLRYLPRRPGRLSIMRGASGNIATEDFNNLCLEMGLETGVSTSEVMAASRRIQSFLERPLESKVLRSGTRQQLYAANQSDGQV